MRDKSDGAGEVDVRTEGEPRRIDLSVPQVAGSALAAVVAAKLASSFGVYGTILGAGLISVVATCGGTVLQHFFKRTGEQLRERRPLGAARTGGGTAPAPVPATAPGEFTEGTVYRARATGRRRPVLAAALVFGVAMAGITTYELASGENLSGGSHTTVGNAFSGHNKSARKSGDADEPGKSDSDSGGSQDSGDSGGSDGSGPTDGTSGSGNGGTPTPTPSGDPDGTGASTAPDGPTDDGDGGTASSPTPAPDATGDEGTGDTGTPAPSATAPAPGAGGRSGTADPGQDGPAAP